MPDVAIKVNQVSKMYRLGAGPQGKGDFRETISSAASKFAQKLLGRLPNASQTQGEELRDLWALRDINFDVNRGEVVGLIGSNGAGKSTLLKILSRITDPTSGEAWFEGRVGSLLEVGTGFHPELSGRENIYLNGAILGMKKKEIDAKFDEIIQFSEIGRFLDTPVKRYSSGMYVRLAFSVAAHLEPEILIIDEVLAVGDASFQRKCISKMKDVARDGKTILFVSHNMGSIQKLCDRAVVLSKGQVIGQATPCEAIKIYLGAASRQQSVALSAREDRRGRGNVRLVHAEIYSEGFEDTPGLLIHGRTAVVRFTVERVLPHMHCKFTIYSSLDDSVCRFSSLAEGPGDSNVQGDQFICEVPDLSLVPGSYRINVAILSGSVQEDHIENALEFEVEYGALNGRALMKGQEASVFVPRHCWTTPQCKQPAATTF